MNALKETERHRPAPTTENTYLAPAVDIFENKDEYVLEADMPGVDKAGLEVLLEGNELTLTGRRQEAPAGDVLHCECNRHDYRRTFVLDPIVDSSKIRAVIEQGLLRVHLPKAEKIKPRKISVA